MSAPSLRDCEAGHLPQIRDILNHAIANSTALYDYHPRSPEQMDAWWEAKARGAHPVIGAFDGDRLCGFGTFGGFRAWPAYKYTVEHSLYVRDGLRRQGLGRLLLGEIIRRAERRDYHVLVGGIDAANEASINLHLSLGFRHAGTIAEAGFKFGRWLDLAFYQLTLRTPADPADG